MKTLRNFAFLALVATLFALDREGLVASSPLETAIPEADPRCGSMDICSEEESGANCIAPWVNPPQETCNQACNDACRLGGHGSNGVAYEAFGPNPIDCGASTWCECYCDFGGTS